jgi:hypothetical protein
MTELDVKYVARIIHSASIYVRNEYPELRAGDASGVARIEFWNELIHRCAGFLARAAPLPLEMIDEAEAEAQRQGIGEWKRFRARLERDSA